MKIQSINKFRFNLQDLRKTPFSIKYIFTLIVGIIVFIGFIWYITPYVKNFFAGLNPPIEVSLIPEKEEVYVDQEFQVSMRLSSRKASALELFLIYDSQIVSYATEYGATTGFSQVTQNYFLEPLIEEVIPSSEEGKKKLHLLIVSHTGELDAVQFNLRFKALQKGQAQFITSVESKIAGSSDDQTATYFDMPENVSTLVTVIGQGDAGTCACTGEIVDENNCNSGFAPICSEDTNSLCSCLAMTPTPSSPTPSPSDSPESITPIQSITVTPPPSDTCSCEGNSVSENNCNDSNTPTCTTICTGDPDSSGVTCRDACVCEGITVPPPIDPTRGDVDLNLKIRFQGVTEQPSEPYRQLNTKIILSAEDKSFREESIIPFIVNNEGIWSGKFSAKNVPLGAKYSIFIKGPKHLMKKVCKLDPSESVSGTYKCSSGNIQLKTGTQNIDFSKIILLVGDIPVQDGIINSVDAVYVRSNFGSQTASIVARADLNLDGIVHTQDMVLMLKALEFKYDEDY